MDSVGNWPAEYNKPSSRVRRSRCRRCFAAQRAIANVGPRRNLKRSNHSMARPSWRKFAATAGNVGSLFFPQREVLGLGRDTFSPSVRAKVAIVAVETRSYERAAVVLEKVGEIEISGRHVGRVAKQIGEALVTEQRTRVQTHRQGTLSVEVANPPRLAVVEFDGGRIRTRQESQGPGTHQPAWRESKNALFLRMNSDIHDRDPCEELPNFLQNRRKVRRLVQEMGGVSTTDAEPDETSPPTESDAYYTPPQRLMRTCLSSLDESGAFGQMMAAEAYRKGFYQATRAAFVGDGMKCNWTIWKKHFPKFVPIVDFIHVLSYLYRAAVAIGEAEEFGWGLCLEWATACWQGRVDEVLSELNQWLVHQPTCEEELADDDPRQIVGRAITYLANNRSRMDYPRYRQLGLPLTSALMESCIKEINYRVKGTEKFWNDPSGADAILALKAASLSDDSRLENCLQT